MGLPRMAVKRPVATATILILILLIGAVSLYQSPLDLLPDISPPVLAIITVFPGSSPQETLELVTRPIEEGVSAVGGLSSLSSVSQEGVSLVIMQFNWGMNVKSVREDINVRMDLLNLPDGVGRPMIMEFDPTLMPIMSVSASGADDRVALTEWLNETASPRLESVLGVAGVQVQGGAREDLFVRTLPEVMDEYAISFDQVANILRASLIDLPAGIIDLGDRQVRIRFLGRYADSDMLKDLVVGFQVDQEKLEEMIGQEVDINLNQVFASPGNPFSALDGGGLGDVPMRVIYWDDYFDFNRGFIANSTLYIPLNREWAGRDDRDIESTLRIFTVNPHISYDSGGKQMALSLGSLGRLKLSSDEGPLFLPGHDTVRLEDVWIVEHAAWDRYRVIIPVDPLSLERYALDEGDLARLAEEFSLIKDANSRYILVTFHDNWEEMRLEPMVSIPDYRSWLSGLQAQIDRGLVDASRSLEDSLTELAISTILGSMTGGGSGFGNFELENDEDFPINPISLGMLAQIEQDTYSPTSITRYNRQPSITLAIQKEGDANTVVVAREVREVLDRLSEESEGLFSRIDFNIALDQAREIERALTDLAEALFGGALLAILVLLLFLKNWRTTMFIALSIPAAVIATFSLLYFADITINLMTLGGLALAAGMLVDNSIVVSENIFRHYQMGEQPAEAAVNGAQEVSGAITASTLTTISVFFPVVFLSGLAGQLFWEFALTVACAILASLLVALTVIPLLASRSLRHRREKVSDQLKPPGLPTYRRLLKKAVSHPWWVIIFVALLLGGGYYGFTTLGTELFPPTEESSFTININLPPGSTMDRTDAYVAEVETLLERFPEIEAVDVSIGGSGFMGLTGGGGNSNRARIGVDLKPGRSGEMDRVIEEVEKEIEALPAEAETSFSRQSLVQAAGLETTLNLVVSGDDLERVTEITSRAEEILDAHPNFTGVQSSLEADRPEIQVRLDQGKALQKGVTQVQVATAVRQALEGIPVSRIETESGILDIVLGYEKSEIKTIEDLGKIGFYTPGGEYLYLEEVATLSEDFGPRSIPRQNQKIVGELDVHYTDIDLGSATEEALEALGSIDLPRGYEIRPAGSFALMEDVLSELELVVIMAVLLVYLVMAAQFESLLHPFIIILSLPMAFIGSILALVITGNNISVPALIGVVVLSGILVNDGIIMVDHINQKRKIDSLPLKDAVIEGAAARLRPILMTTATTVLGLLPLALGLGEGAQLQAPMALTIIGGQVTGTLLLLLAIPSVYMVLTREKTGMEAPAAGAFGGEPFNRREKSGLVMIMRLVLVILLFLVLVAVAVALFLGPGLELMGNSG